MAAGSGERMAGERGAGWLLAVAEPAMASLLLLYLLYQFLLSHVEGDQAYLLYAAQQVLNGVQLDGPRLVETNPPLIVWFSTVPAALGRWLHMDAVLSLRLVVSCLLVASAGWGWRVLRVANLPGARPRTLRLLWAATFLLVTLTQPAEFGQREQLLLALLLPYLLAVGTDAVDRLSVVERTALGACAGLAICFKPQHLLTFLCLHLFLGMTRRLHRLLSVETAAFVATGLLYLGAVQLFTPAYLGVIVPLLRSTYWALGQYSFAAMALHVGRGLTLAVLVAAAAWFLLRRHLRWAQLEGALLASGAGATLAYFVQHTGWYHQKFAALALLEAGAVWIAVDLLQGSRRLTGVVSPSHAASRVRSIAWIALPLCAVLLFGTVYQRRQHAATSPPGLVSELGRLSPGTTVYAFSVGMNAFPAVVERRLVWGSRFAHLWMVPAIRANEAPVPADGRPFLLLTGDRLAELAALQRRETAEDLRRTQPAAIFVERCAQHRCDGYTTPFDAVQWFSQDDDFAAFWRGYRRVRQLADFDVYERNR